MRGRDGRKGGLREKKKSERLVKGRKGGLRVKKSEGKEGTFKGKEE